jgi:hypothetical protein
VSRHFGDNSSDSCSKALIAVAFHPSADGQSEKTNSTVQVMIRCFIGEDSDKYKRWVDYLPIVEHENNNASQSSTGFSLNELRYSTKMRGISDLLCPVESMSESAEELADQLRNHRDEAGDSIAIAQQKQSCYYDGRHQKEEFKIGDLVVLKFN